MTEIEWWHLDHRCPVCGTFWPATESFEHEGERVYFYSAHARYADHMIRVHNLHGQRPCDEDCAGCVSNRAQEKART